MANWSNPGNTSSYLDVLAELKARDVDTLSMLKTCWHQCSEWGYSFC